MLLTGTRKTMLPPVRVPEFALEQWCRRHELPVEFEVLDDTADQGAPILEAAHGFSALLEGEGIASAGDRYNSGANGVTTRPAITDPEGAELNQAYLAWKGGHAGATLGRQRLLFDNQRWIGNSGWRQNEQTFDAVAFDVGLRPGLTARYA